MPASSPQTYPDPESYFTIGPYITDPQKFFISKTQWEEDLTEPERALLLAYLRSDGKIDPIANKEVLHGLV